jgi:hypothetical protein
MSTFDIRTDAPGLLRNESLNITLVFTRTSDTSGRVSWNVPTPAAGCGADDQAYCGMLVTLSTTPTNLSKSPVDGTVYSSDPSASSTLHAGDKISDALVIGAFYNDRTTTFFDVTDLQPNTPYYVSGFPTDCQFRYYREGVHAYSTAYTTPGTDGTSGTQVVLVNYTTDPGGVSLSDATGLDSLAQYTFEVTLGIEPRPSRPLRDQECALVPPTYDIVVEGANSQTYEQLINEINRQFALIQSPVVSATYPFQGSYVVTGNPKKLYQWNGLTHVELPVIVQELAPNDVSVGSYWFDPDVDLLYRWDGSAWVQTQYITYATDPTEPLCDQTIWFNGVQGYLWNGTTWCTTPTYIQSTDPSVVTVPCGSYWYNTGTEYLFKWNENTHAWVSVDAIQSSVDPTTLVDGSYWYDETNEALFIRNTGAWDPVANVQYTTTAPAIPVANMVWYNVAENELNIRNAGNTAWVLTDVIAYPTDPSNPGSCELWWSESGGDVTLNIWNVEAGEWVEVTLFYEQSTDPSAQPVIAQNSIWVNGDVIYVWSNNCFVESEVIVSPTDPTELPDGTVWYDSNDEIWFERVAGAWAPIFPTVTSTDPLLVPVGTFWYNTITTALTMWNGTVWVTLAYSNAFTNVPLGQLWYDTTSGQLKEWNGSTYVVTKPLVTVELNCHNNLIFTHTEKSSRSFVVLKDGNLFESLNVNYKFDASFPGTDGVSDLPSYTEEGIGTDGSPDERLKLANEIRYELGYPVFDVELTAEQLDLAITRAISELRSRSSIAYKHAYFFMRTQGNEQKYYLTNKIAGMHKIVTVLAVRRLTSSFLSSAHGAGVYGQIILQQLYNMGNFDILSYHAQAEYVKTLEIMFAGRITFTWDEHKRELFLHHRFPFAERMILIEAMVERTEQDILNDRWTKEWIRKYSAALSKMMLSQIRGKFSTLPGAGGSVTLNANELQAQGEATIKECLQEIEDFVVDKPEDIGYTSTFVFG